MRYALLMVALVFGAEKVPFAAGTARTPVQEPTFVWVADSSLIKAKPARSGLTKRPEHRKTKSVWRIILKVLLWLAFIYVIASLAVLAIVVALTGRI